MKLMVTGVDGKRLKYADLKAENGFPNHSRTVVA